MKKKINFHGNTNILHENPWNFTAVTIDDACAKLY